jgi:hypothetical protein
MTANTKTCLACSQTIKGRTDKKFCDDTCRNNYNNRLNSDATPLMRTITNILRRNRRILEEVLSGRKTIHITNEKLAAKGFRFQYFTHTYTNQKDGTYYYCYDYGYMKKDNNIYLVVKELPELAER